MEVKEGEIDPQFLHGFTLEQLENDPQGCLLSGNLQRMHEARSALNAKFLMVHGGTRKEIAEDTTPLWQKMSGLTPERERAARPREREQMIFVLLKAVEKLIRSEFRDEAARTREGTGVLSRGRALTWEPVRAVCFHLQISQRKLTHYSKEALGISIWEMADAVRAEAVRGRMKSALKGFVGEYFNRRRTERMGEGEKGGKGETPHPAFAPLTSALSHKGRGEDGGPHPWPLSHEGRGEKGTPHPALTTFVSALSHKGRGEKGEETAEEIWEALVKTRRAPRFHRTSWALSFGFSSYTRFFRACLNCYGVTPHELEFLLIEEILAEAETGNDNCNGGHEGHEDGLKGRDVEREVEVVRRE